MARRAPVNRLNSVDFPTLGRPTSTTEGRREVGTGSRPILQAEKSLAHQARHALDAAAAAAWRHVLASRSANSVRRADLRRFRGKNGGFAWLTRTRGAAAAW